MIILSKIITTTCEGLVMLHSTSSRSVVSFAYQWQDNSIEASLISDNVVNSKMKHYRLTKSIKKDNVLLK